MFKITNDDRYPHDAWHPAGLLQRMVTAEELQTRGFTSAEAWTLVVAGTVAPRACTFGDDPLIFPHKDIIGIKVSSDYPLLDIEAAWLADQTMQGFREVLARKGEAWFRHQYRDTDVLIEWLKTQYKPSLNEINNRAADKNPRPYAARWGHGRDVDCPCIGTTWEMIR